MAVDAGDTVAVAGGGGRPGGLRHDNDKDDVADILVVPTADELLCGMPPYLPLPPTSEAGGGAATATEGASAAAAAATDTAGRLVDSLFRLAREDLVRPLREAILAYRASAVAAEARAAGAAAPAAGSRAAAAVAPADLDVYRRARVDGVAMHPAHVVRVRVAFDAPAGARGDGGPAATRFWAAAPQLLRVGTLAILCRGLLTPTPLLLFGVIVERDVDPALRQEDPHAPAAGRFSGPAVEMMPCRHWLGDWLSAAAAGSPADAGGSTAPTELLLLHAPRMGYEVVAPVLRALASMAPRLPFADILAAPPGACAPPRPPAYLLDAPAAARALDLNDLVDDPARRSPALSAVDVLAPGGDDAWPAAELARRTSLDAAQVRALRAALSTSVVLLRGAPGTGKSFLCVRLVQLLVQRHRRLRAARVGGSRRSAAAATGGGGILVVSATGHGLDQFLIGLLDRGVDGVVHVGGPSYHPRLAACSLHAQVYCVLSPGAAHGESAVAPGDLAWQGQRLAAATQRLRDAGVGDLAAYNKALIYFAPLLQDLHDELHRLGAGEDATWDLFDSFFFETYPALFRSIVEGPSPAGAAALPVDTAAGGVGSDGRGGGHRNVGASAQGGTVAPGAAPSDEDWFRTWQRGGGGGLPAAAGAAPQPATAAASPAAGGTAGDRVDEDTDEDFERLSYTADAWSVPPPMRRRLLAHWLRGVLPIVVECLSASHAEVQEILARDRNEEANAALVVLRAASVVGVTARSVADIQALIAVWAPQVVVLDGEVSEAHSVAVLHGGVQQLILTGDPERLRPACAVYDLSVDSGRGFNVDASLFERLAGVSGYANAHDLRTQRRAPVVIADLVRATLHPALADAPSLRDNPAAVPGMGMSVFFWEHNVAEVACHDGGDLSGSSARAVCSPHEVGMVLALTRYLLLQGVRVRDLVVLTSTPGQLALLRDALSVLTGVVVETRDQEALHDLCADAGSGAGAREGGRTATSARDEDDLLRLATVDNFQGAEADVVIASMVRCNAGGDGGAFSVPARIAQLLSRAKRGLYLVGSLHTLMQRGHTPGGVAWARVFDSLRAAASPAPCA